MGEPRASPGQPRGHCTGVGGPGRREEGAPGEQAQWERLAGEGGKEPVAMGCSGSSRTEPRPHPALGATVDGGALGVRKAQH